MSRARVVLIAVAAFRLGVAVARHQHGRRLVRARLYLIGGGKA